MRLGAQARNWAPFFRELKHDLELSLLGKGQSCLSGCLEGC
jgi:hypothetical protein